MKGKFVALFIGAWDWI
uniref:Uncharacterized protein n=1 Tax=Rhizophora mucronata TaxID=61149 RepID=A0A2P2PEU9_RHIMU